MAFRPPARSPKIAATAHIPIVLVTTKDQVTDKVWGLRQGAKAYLTKPVNETQLVELVNELLAGRTPRRRRDEPCVRSRTRLTANPAPTARALAGHASQRRRCMTDQYDVRLRATQWMAMRTGCYRRRPNERSDEPHAVVGSMNGYFFPAAQLYQTCRRPAPDAPTIVPRMYCSLPPQHETPPVPSLPEWSV
jgi:hypothetical protein